MSKEERKGPELRFKGFHDDWKQRNISNIAILNPKSSLPETFKYIDLESVKDNRILSYKEERAHSAPSRAQRVASKGDIFFQTVRPYQKNNFLYNLNDNDYVFSTGYAQIRPFISSHFLLYRLLEDNFVNKVLRSSTGTSYPAINSQDLSKINFAIPIDEMEQEKIGALLNKLNNYIVLHQQKANIMKEIKLLYLEKLFAIAEFLHPNIRFKGYTNEWISSQIKKYLIERNERSNIGDLVSVTINSGVLKTESLNRKNNSSDDKSNYKVVKKGDIPYNSMRMWQGASGLSPFNGILSPAYTVLIPKETASGKFFSYQFKSKSMLYQFQKYSQGLTSDTWNLKYPLLKNIKISVPEFKEQKEIGDFLSEIDKNIELHQRRINKLKTIKKVYLDKMFI